MRKLCWCLYNEEALAGAHIMRKLCWCLYNEKGLVVLIMVKL